MWKKGISKKTYVGEGDIKEKGHRGRKHQERGQDEGDVKERDCRGSGMWKMSIKAVIEEGAIEEEGHRGCGMSRKGQMKGTSRKGAGWRGRQGKGIWIVEGDVEEGGHGKWG